MINRPVHTYSQKAPFMYVTTISSLKEQKYEIYWKNYSLNDAVVLKVEPQRFTTTKNEALKLYGSGGFSL